MPARRRAADTGRMKQRVRTTAALAAFAIAAAALPLPAAAGGREVRCASLGMWHNYCPIGLHGPVNLLKSDDMWSCREDETWGVDTLGIWVDKGCKASFWVLDRSDMSLGSGGGLVAGAAVVGAGLMALLAAHRDKARMDEGSDQVPTWLVGSYRGVDPAGKSGTHIDIGASGRYTISAGGSTSVGSWQSGNELRGDDGTRYRVERTDRGMRLTSLADGRQSADYVRN